MIDISIIIPIYNEEENIPILVNRLRSVLTQLQLTNEIIFINDGSYDTSLSVVKNLSHGNPNIKYISFSRNFGHQIAVTAGLEKCMGACAVIIDADLQDPPELIEQLYTEYKKGYQVVYAQRTVRKGESYFKKLSANLFYRVLKHLTEIDIPLNTGDFRLIDRKVINSLKQMKEQNKFLRGQIAWLGYTSKPVYFEREERHSGETGYSLSKMIKLALDGITSFSNKPLEFVAKLGIAFSFISFGVLIYSLLQYFIYEKTIVGWTSIIATITFFGGIQLIAVGVIGAYLARMNQNVISRPTYIIEDHNISG